MCEIRREGESEARVAAEDDAAQLIGPGVSWAISLSMAALAATSCPPPCIDDEPSTTKTRSRGVARPVHGVPTDVAQATTTGADCTLVVVIVPEATSVSLPRFGPA